MGRGLVRQRLILPWYMFFQSEWCFCLCLRNKGLLTSLHIAGLTLPLPGFLGVFRVRVFGVCYVSFTLPLS